MGKGKPETLTADSRGQTRIEVGQTAKAKSQVLITKY